MKKVMTIGVAAAVMVLTSCGGGSKKIEKIEVAKVKPESTSVSGDLSDYLQVVDNEYEVVEDWGGKLSIKVKATKPYEDGDINEKEVKLSASLLGDNGMPVSGTGEFEIESSSEDKLNSLLTKGSGEEVIRLKTELGEYSVEDHAEKAKKFSLSSTVKDKKVSSSSSSSSDNSSDDYSTSSSSSSSEDWDAVLDDFEELVDKYIKFYKKAMKGDMGSILEYPALLEKATSLDEKLESAKGDMTAKQVGRMAKIQTKMLQAATEY